MAQRKKTMDGVSITNTGTTTDTYAEVEWPCLGYSNKLITLKNSAAANGLTFKAVGYSNEDGVYYDLVSDTAVVAGDIWELSLIKPYQKIVISVKSTVAATPATYVLDFVGD